MESDDLDPYDGGASSVERRGSEPLCSFDAERGFSLKSSTADELRWYTYLNPDDLDGGLLQSEHDD
jgi:hypothetical protein